MFTNVGNWVYAVIGGLVGALVLLLALRGSGGEDDEDIGDAWDDFWDTVEGEF